MPPEQARSAAPGKVCQLKITLQDSRPPIWRRVLVPDDSTLIGLHRVIQAAMGWADYHLWRFVIGGEELGVRARDVRLRDVAGAGDVLLYEYDFGDAWEHRIQIERVLPAERGREYPALLDAERACPPEDSGGIGGYEHLLAVLANPRDPEHADLLAWVGGAFDPEAVDRREINRRLALSRPREGGEPLAPAHNPAEAMIREVRELAQRTLEENPHASLDELNAILAGASASYNTRAQPDLGGLSPDQVRRLLGADWEGAGSAVQLNASLPLAELEGAYTLHNAHALLELLAEEGPVKSTPKGNLPRALVAAMREQMRWPEGYRDLALEGRKVLNEEDLFPLHVTRILLELAGLVKRRKGVFSLTRAGERLRGEARAGELFATLFRTHFRTLNLGFLDRAEPLPEFQHTVAFALYRFGRVGTQWHTREELKAEVVLPAVRDALPPEPFYDSLAIALELRLLRPLEGFGLAEIQALPREPGSWRDEHRYRKTALFDRFLRFDL